MPNKISSCHKIGTDAVTAFMFDKIIHKALCQFVHLYKIRYSCDKTAHSCIVVYEKRFSRNNYGAEHKKVIISQTKTNLNVLPESTQIRSMLTHLSYSKTKPMRRTQPKKPYISCLSESCPFVMMSTLRRGLSVW